MQLLWVSNSSCEGLSVLYEHRIIASHRITVSLSLSLSLSLSPVCCVWDVQYSTLRYTYTTFTEAVSPFYTTLCFCSDRSDNRSEMRPGFRSFRLFVHRVNFHFFPTLFASFILRIKSRFWLLVEWLCNWSQWSSDRPSLLSVPLSFLLGPLCPSPAGCWDVEIDVEKFITFITSHLLLFSRDPGC